MKAQGSSLSSSSQDFYSSFVLQMSGLTFQPCRLIQSLEVESTFDLFYETPHPYTEDHSVGKQITDKNGYTCWLVFTLGADKIWGGRPLLPKCTLMAYAVFTDRLQIRIYRDFDARPPRCDRKYNPFSVYFRRFYDNPTVFQCFARYYNHKLQW